MLKQRIITAIVLVALSIWALFYSTDLVWKGVILAVGFIAAWEWTRFAKIDAQALQVTYAMSVTLIANYASTYLSFSDIGWLTLIEALLLMLVVLRYQFTKGQSGLQSMSMILLAGMLVIVPFVVAMVLFRNEFGPEVVLLSLLLVWTIDTGAYFSGRRFGKNKLAVFVSPGKTWEGVYSGALLSLFVAVIVLWYLKSELIFAWWLMAVLLAAIAAFSVFGDLFESVLKRQAGLKDSGKILPGHGGVLDRIDSLLIAVPMLYVLWHFAINVN